MGRSAAVRSNEDMAAKATKAAWAGVIVQALAALATVTAVWVAVASVKSTKD